MKFGALATMAFVLFFGLALASVTGTAGLAPDGDSDGVPNLLDNCSGVYNVSPFDPKTGKAGGCDKDQDGYGNACDTDFTDGAGGQDLATDGADLTVFNADFKKGSDAGSGTDLNCDGTVDGADLTQFKAAFKAAAKPGPSGLTCASKAKAGCANSQ